MKRRIAILGASRGLGAYLAQKVAAEPSDMLLVARKLDLLKDLKTKLYQNGHREHVFLLSSDFSKEEGQFKTIDFLNEFQPNTLFYVAGGGPYGSYGSKHWKDHLWAYQVGFLFPAQVCHWGLRADYLKQIILIGSSVAESKGDSLAASYSASKHALLGLHQSLIAEKAEKDIRLFSPGYLDTELLPMNSWPRENGECVLDPELVAGDLYDWSNSLEGYQQHKIHEPS